MVLLRSLSPRNFIERLVILEEEGGAGSFNNVISPKDLEFLRRIGNKLMQLSLDRGGSRVDERGGVRATNFSFFLYPFPSNFFFLSFFFWSRHNRPRTISPFPRLIVAIPPLERNFSHDPWSGNRALINISSIRLGQLTYFFFFSFCARALLESCILELVFK